MSGVRDKDGRKGKGENGDKKADCLNYYRRLARSFFVGILLPLHDRKILSCSC